MIFDKSMIGNTVFALPTGNALRKYGNSIFKFEVVAVKRKYVDLKEIFEDGSVSPTTTAYCTETGATQKAINSGYGSNSGLKFFRTTEELEGYLTLVELRSILKTQLNELNIDDLKAEQIKSLNIILNES
ncbi:hypothetical protein JCM30760_26330 [Thiomicrorhabdus hydrogeniphila]